MNNVTTNQIIALMITGGVIGVGLGAIGTMLALLPQINRLDRLLREQIREQRQELDWEQNDNRLAEIQLYERNHN